MKANPAIVALLMDVDMARSTFPAKLFHTNGDPFTVAETALVGDASYADLESARNLCQLGLEFHQQQFELHQRLVELAAPHMTSPDMTLADARDLMSAPEREELQRILDQLAPP